jgi:invasion protein IalB
LESCNKPAPFGVLSKARTGGYRQYFILLCKVILRSLHRWHGDETGKCWHWRGHAPASFGDDTTIGWGDRSGRSAVRAVSKRDLVMVHRLVFAPARLAACALVVSAATTILTALTGFGAFAQTPPAPPAPAPKAQPAPKAAPKAAPAPKPAEAPAPQAQQGQPQGGEQPQLIFSPWTKFCLKGQEANAKQVCFTGKDGRVESGMPVVAAVLIEPENEPKKVLRVTLPLGMSIQPGTRVIVDSGQPMTGPYVICFNNGCMADYEASGELIGKLKKGQGLVIQGINGAGQPISLVVPLGDFGKAYDGPPTDPKVFEEQQKKLQDELQRRAEEARKKLEGQQQAAPSR